MKAWIGVILVSGLAAIQPARAFDQSHREWTAILAKPIDGNSFDCAGLKTEKAGVESCLKTPGAVSGEEFKRWDRDERLALLINPYNAATINLIPDHLEHELIRANYHEPRIHFALNFASAACPKLRREALVGAKLDAGLVQGRFREALRERGAFHRPLLQRGRPGEDPWRLA